VTPARRWRRFSAVSGAGFVLQLSVVAALTAWTAVPAPAATAAGVTAAVVHNFYWHVRWTWADRVAARSHPFGAFARFAAANGAVSLCGNVAFVALLVHLTPLDAVAANAAAVAACSLMNYWSADRIAFHEQGVG
jgi:putative flippase GtrA